MKSELLLLPVFWYSMVLLNCCKNTQLW